MLLEHAWRQRALGDASAAAASLSALASLSAVASGERSDEACYLGGLLACDQGHGTEALEIWRPLLTGQPASPWAHRADWACSVLTPDTPRSPLGRTYDRTLPHPDLARTP